MSVELDPHLSKLLSTATPAPTFTAEGADPDSRKAYLAGLRSWDAERQQRLDPDTFAGQITTLTIPTRDGAVAARVYRPDAGAATDLASPVIAWFHGGGFIFGDLDDTDPMAAQVATISQCTVVSVEYRLAPETPFPGGLHDCYDATVWVVANANALGVDPARLAVAGDSAGGNLAAGVTMLARDADHLPAIAFQLLIYPKLDFTQVYPSALENAEIGMPPDMTAFFDDCYIPNASTRTDPLASPVLADDLTRLPNALIVTAEADTLRDEAELYGRRLLAAGVETATLRAIGLTHGFLPLTDTVPSARQIANAAYAAVGHALRAVS